MAYRKSTLRRLPATTRKVARLIGELDSISRRAKNLLVDVASLEHDSRALAHATQKPDCYWRVGSLCANVDPTCTTTPSRCNRDYGKCSLHKPRD